jgi:hypothetical protein
MGLKIGDRMSKTDFSQRRKARKERHKELNNKLIQNSPKALLLSKIKKSKF